MIRCVINMIEGMLWYKNLNIDNAKCIIFLCDQDFIFSQKVVEIVKKNHNACFVTCHKSIKVVCKDCIFIPENDMKKIIQYISFWKNPLGINEFKDNVYIASLYSEWSSFELFDLVKKNIFDLDYVIKKFVIGNEREE